MPIKIEDPRLGRFEWDQERWLGSLPLQSGRVIQFNIVPATNNHSEQPNAPWRVHRCLPSRGLVA